MTIACLQREVGKFRRPRPRAELHLELHAPVERPLPPLGTPVRVRLLLRPEQVVKTGRAVVGGARR